MTDRMTGEERDNVWKWVERVRNLAPWKDPIARLLLELRDERDEALALSAVYRDALEQASYRRFYAHGEYRGCSVCERATYDTPAEPHEDHCIVGRALALSAPAALARYQAAERVAEAYEEWQTKMFGYHEPASLFEERLAWRALEEGTQR